MAVGSWSFSLHPPLHQHFIFVPLKSSHSDVHGRIVHLWNSDFLLIVQLVADTLCRFHHIGSCRINSHHRCRESLPPYSSPSPLLIIVWYRSMMALEYKYPLAFRCLRPLLRQQSSFGRIVFWSAGIGVLKMISFIYILRQACIPTKQGKTQRTARKLSLNAI